MGEAEFGLVDGVVGTRAGMLDGEEVVEVEFDPRVVSFASLLDHATAHDCARRVWTTTDPQRAVAIERLGARTSSYAGGLRPDTEPKYYLGKTALRHLPMTELQAMRINARLGRDETLSVLTDSQRELLSIIRANPERDWPVAIGIDVRVAWDRASMIRGAIGAADKQTRR